MSRADRMKNFLRDKLCIGHSGDDKDDDLCLSKALLRVSDEFDSLSYNVLVRCR